MKIFIEIHKLNYHVYIYIYRFKKIDNKKNLFIYSFLSMH